MYVLFIYHSILAKVDQVANIHRKQLRGWKKDVDAANKELDRNLRRIDRDESKATLKDLEKYDFTNR